MTIADYRKQAIQRGLRIGAKVKIVEKKKLHNRESYVIKVTNGIVTALYPYVFTVEMIGQRNDIMSGKKNIIKTSFQYVQVIMGEVELCR